MTGLFDNARRMFETKVQGRVSDATIRGYLRAGSQIENIWIHIDARIDELVSKGLPPWEAYTQLRYALAFVRAARSYVVFVQELLKAEEVAHPADAEYVARVVFDQADALCQQVEPSLNNALAAMNDPMSIPNVAVPFALGPRIEYDPCPLSHLQGLINAALEMQGWAAGLLAKYENTMTTASNVPTSVTGHISALHAMLAQADFHLNFGTDLVGQVTPHDTTFELHKQAEDALWDAMQGYFRINQVVADPALLQSKQPLPNVPPLTAPGLAATTPGTASSPPKAAKPPPLVTPKPYIPPSVTYYGHTGPVAALAWSPDGTRIVSAGIDQTVHVWDVISGKCLHIYSGHEAPISVVAWSPDSAYIASGSQDTTVRVWNVASGGMHCFVYRGHVAPVSAVGWSPDGAHLASGSRDKTVQVWRASNGEPIYTYREHTGHVSVLAWSPHDTLIASGSWDKTVRVWDAISGVHHCTYRGHSEPVYALAWSPQLRSSLPRRDTHIASGSADGAIQVWDASTVNLCFNYSGHATAVTALAWSPDSTQVASGSADGAIQVWDGATGQQQWTYREHSSQVSALAWSPDSTRVASASDDGTVQVREVQDLRKG